MSEAAPDDAVPGAARPDDPKPDVAASDAAEAAHETPASEVRDELPEDLDRYFVTPYEFPDNKRRRIPGLIYLAIAVVVFVVAAAAGDGAVLVNRGLVIGAVALVAIGIYHLVAALPLTHDENDALVVATRTVGFPVGHASAQLGWRGLRSRPTWRILLYSADDPPTQRGLVLVDAVDGRAVDHVVESNPEDWSGLAAADGTVPDASPSGGLATDSFASAVPSLDERDEQRGSPRAERNGEVDEPGT